MLTLAIATSALAGNSVGRFEIDGNRADDSGPGDLILDWDSPPPNLTHFTDGTGSGDDASQAAPDAFNRRALDRLLGTARPSPDLLHAYLPRTAPRQDRERIAAAHPARL